ncbi:hypothetical protein SAMN04487941_2330 [Pontibacter akesuensis]|uniref:Uncharacterized protein n=1 Tax=Pontibacter akesuensis TaxID=388950 RepID=A0A1I7IMQ3_9BACT|nr:hypothetical protein SAMN04487941_2330 [Pontibacter akesuensis]
MIGALNEYRAFSREINFEWGIDKEVRLNNSKSFKSSRYAS